MRLPLETKHHYGRKYRNKHASICRTTLCLFLAGSACSAKEEGELQIGWSLSWLLLLTLSFACYKAKDPAKQLIHFHFDEGKSHRPFGTITKCDGKVTRIRLYLDVCNKACEANTKQAPLSECDDQMRWVSCYVAQLCNTVAGGQLYFAVKWVGTCNEFDSDFKQLSKYCHTAGPRKSRQEEIQTADNKAKSR